MGTEVRIEGLDDLRKSLRKVSPQLSKALQKAHKAIAQMAVDKIKPAVAGLPSPGGSRAVSGITPRATQKQATVAFSGAANKRPLKGTILGSNTHTLNWPNQRHKKVKTSSMRNRVWQPHLGNRWQPEQLYGAGPVFQQAKAGFIREEYLEGVLKAIRESF